MNTRIVHQFTGDKEESGRTPLRTARSKPSPIRSMILSVSTNSISTSGWRSMNSMTMGTTCRRPSAAELVRRIVPRKAFASSEISSSSAVRRAKSSGLPRHIDGLPRLTSCAGSSGQEAAPSAAARADVPACQRRKGCIPKRGRRRETTVINNRQKDFQFCLLAHLFQILSRVDPRYPINISCHPKYLK